MTERSEQSWLNTGQTPLRHREDSLPAMSARPWGLVRWESNGLGSRDKLYWTGKDWTPEREYVARYNWQATISEQKVLCDIGWEVHRELMSNDDTL